MADHLPRYRDVLAVCAHPDDESFGLGAIITLLTETGTRVRLLCFTAGEDSTLGAGPDLARRRADELDCAARALGIDHVALLDHPDGALSTTAIGELAAQVADAGRDADALLAFDRGGITGHPDHQHATAAAVAAADQLDVPVWGWTIPAPIAATLQAEFDVPFVGRSADHIDLELEVDRTRQLQAIDCHGSQLANNPVPCRRIELQGATESLRLLYTPSTTGGQGLQL